MRKVGIRKGDDQPTERPHFQMKLNIIYNGNDVNVFGQSEGQSIVAPHS